MKIVRMLICLIILTGGIYPLLITAIAQMAMKEKANGSLIFRDGRIVGSSLLGQKFTSEKYFLSRPSAVHYNTLPSGGSNLGPTSAVLKKQVNQRREFWESRTSNNTNLSLGLYSSDSEEFALQKLEFFGKANSQRRFARWKSIRDVTKTLESEEEKTIPSDLLFASGSGLDPHISPLAAFFQHESVARARGMENDKVRTLILKNMENRLIGGPLCVNVLKLNLALDGMGEKDER
jgi:potassium-transporting ATPase KdpC subunit